MYDVVLYETESGRIPVEEYVEKLAKQKKIAEIAQLLSYEDRLKQYGMTVNNVFPETIRKLRGDIYELRPGDNRVFLFSFTERKIVLLHAYRKFKQKTPNKEIDKAEKEMKDYVRRHGK